MSKGLNVRPRIKPNTLGKRRRRGKITRGVAVQDRVIKAQVPPGSRFKGYETYGMQDVVLRRRGGALPPGALDHARLGQRAEAAFGAAV